MLNFKTLLVWQRSHQLTLKVYKATDAFPLSELYGLTSQLRRCTVSVASNIAEGCGRNSDPELSRFLIISMGSAAEAEYQLLLAHDLGYLSEETYHTLNNDIVEICKMLNSFISKVKQRIHQTRNT